MNPASDGQQQAPPTPPPEFAQMWRDWLTESERQFNAFLNQAMSTDASARTMGGYMEAYAAFQRIVAEGMQRYLSFMNMPSRTDVLQLGETLRDIEERIARIEEMLQIAAEATDGIDGPLPAREEPMRTRRPESFMPDEIAPKPAPMPEVTPQSISIPEELRR